MSEAVVLRAATDNDIEQMFRVSALAHQRGYSNLIPNSRRADFDKRYEINNLNLHTYKSILSRRILKTEWDVNVALIDGLVVGYTMSKLINPLLLIKRGLFVHPEHQGKGVGKLLFENSLERINKGEIKLFVIEKNIPAITMYSKHGFKVTKGVTKEFYGSQQLIMSLLKN
jgi:ribosomal protein S18 acetylase RimI-like enzyme